MAEFLKDKPSSRVLRPPGGATSNIFGGAEERNEPNKAVKPTFQSSVFNTDPEPVQGNSKNRPSVTSSSIFAPEGENTNQNSPKKVSRTHQSSIFSESDTNNANKPARKRISNIPMFTQTGPEELRRPVRRPITAPSGISACFSSQSSLDARTPVGQRKKVLAGFKPANPNLQSTVFSEPKHNDLKGRKHFVESTEIDLALSSVVPSPIVEGESVNAEQGEAAALGKSQQFSRTYLSVAFDAPQEGVECPVYAVDGSILNSSKKFRGCNTESTLFKLYERDDQPAVSSFSQLTLPRFTGEAESGSIRRCRANSRLHQRRSTIFDDDDPSQQQRLWSSGFAMASCRSRNAVENDTYRSHVLSRGQSPPNPDSAIGECEKEFRSAESINLGNNNYASRTRYDPITGTVIGRPSSSTSETSNASDKNPTTANGSSNNVAVTDTNNQPGANEPRLGPVKNESGIRCAQPPGGKSTFSLF